MEGSRFNVRVYGLWVEAGRVLVNEETIREKKYLKFPGGGLEYGEGIVNCLHREWQEELNLEIRILKHFYTTDFFQKSAFDKSQVISIYYLVEAAHPSPYIVNVNEEEYTHWIKIENITPDTFTLPIDKIVGEMLVSQYRGK